MRASYDTMQAISKTAWTVSAILISAQTPDPIATRGSRAASVRPPVIRRPGQLHRAIPLLDARCPRTRGSGDPPGGRVPTQISIGFGMEPQLPLPSGFTPPSYRVALLRTLALNRLEAEGLSHKAILVTAPAGYGKTALLSQWRLTLRTAGVRTAWMSLAADRTDPTHLLTYLTMSLIDAGIDLGPAENLAQQWFADTPIPAAMAAIAGQLARDRSPIVLLIDDAHHLPRAAAEQVLGPLLLPGLEHVHVTLASRTKPALSIAGLRARGELLECKAEVLRFTERELGELLPDLTISQRALLASRTEGWPVAVQLARLWLTAKPERAALIAGFTGHTIEVAEYLTEQVLGDLPADMYRTLETTAPLDALCAGVVEAITHAPEAWAAITEYSPLAHLIVPVDDTREWYRLHPLLP